MAMSGEAIRTGKDDGVVTKMMSERGGPVLDSGDDLRNVRIDRDLPIPTPTKKVASRKNEAGDPDEAKTIGDDGGSGTRSSRLSTSLEPSPFPTYAPPPVADLSLVAATPNPSKKKPRLSEDELVAKIAAAARTIIECIDDDPERDGLTKTPVRYAKALLNLTAGRRTISADVLSDAQFDENHTEMVLVRGIDVFSHCEHHLLPFHGVCHVAYMPKGSVIGLSKIARIVEMYAHHLQVQERLTTQIADSVMEATGVQGVMVYIICTRMCMVMRGVRKTGADTITTAARGCYLENQVLRQEFLAHIRS